MIASRSGRPELYFPSNTKKSALSPVSFPTSLQQLKKPTLRHIFNNRRYTLLIDIVEKKTNQRTIAGHVNPEKPIMEK